MVAGGAYRTRSMTLCSFAPRTASSGAERPNQSWSATCLEGARRRRCWRKQHLVGSWRSGHIGSTSAEAYDLDGNRPCLMHKVLYSHHVNYRAPLHVSSGQGRGWCVRPTPSSSSSKAGAASKRGVWSRVMSELTGTGRPNGRRPGRKPLRESSRLINPDAE